MGFSYGYRNIKQNQEAKNQPINQNKYSDDDLEYLSKLLVNYLNFNKSKIMFVNGKPIVASGPNAGGYSPVVGFSSKDSVTGEKINNYNELKSNFDYLVRRCGFDKTKNYFENILAKNPSLDDVSHYFSCAGKISFSDTYFGAE